MANHRSTYNALPLNPPTPLLITFTPTPFPVDTTPVTDNLYRCTNCKAYINPFVKIIAPGTQWRCNLCLTVNQLEVPLAADEPCITYDTIDFLAPASFTLRPAQPPNFIFVFDASEEAKTRNVFSASLRVVLNGIEALPLNSKVALVLYEKYVKIFKTFGFYALVEFDEIPFFNEEDVFFSVEKTKSRIDALLKEKTTQHAKTESCGSNVEFSKKTESIPDPKNSDQCLKNTLSTIQRLVSSAGATVLIFNTVCATRKDSFYNSIANEFARQNICANLFVFPYKQIELSTLSVLPRKTGGSIFYEPTFKGDFESVSKLATDYSTHFEQRYASECVARLRVSTGCDVVAFYGQLTVLRNGMLAIPAHNACHSITAEIKTSQTNKFFCQFAMLRTLSDGRRTIRVLNMELDVFKDDSFRNEESIDFYALRHFLFLKGYEQKDSDDFVLKTGLKLFKETKNEEVLVAVNNVRKALCRAKEDFGAYYAYLLSSHYPSVVDVLISPVLYSFVIKFNQNEEDKTISNNLIINDVDCVRVPLSLDNLDTSGIYILDSVTAIYIFIGLDCSLDTQRLVVDDEVNSGRFVLSRKENKLSSVINSFIYEIISTRFVTPIYFLIRDDGRSDIYLDMFFSLFYEDAVRGLPSLKNFIDKVRSGEIK